MKKPNNIEKELDKIRTDIYEIIKDMSSSEKTAYMRAQVAPMYEQYGIHPMRQTTPDVQRKAQ